MYEAEVSVRRLKINIFSAIAGGVVEHLASESGLNKKAAYIAGISTYLGIKAVAQHASSDPHEIDYNSYHATLDNRGEV